MTQHEEDGLAKIDFVQPKINSLSRENDQEEDQYFDQDVCNFEDENWDGGEGLEFVTIIKIGNEQSEVEVEQFQACSKSW